MSYSQNLYNEATVITRKLDTVNGWLENIEHQIDTYCYLILQNLTNFQQGLGEYLNIDVSVDWSKDWYDEADSMFTHSVKETLKEALLDVYKTIDNTVNPRSDDNVEAFDGALTNIKDNTFIGSAYQVVDTVPNDIINALSKDSSPVLTFKTAGVKSGHFNLPEKTYSLDFSWYAPFKGVGDTVVSCFMYLGFLFAFFKRLPEILHGSGILYTGSAEFHESQLESNVAKTMANDYYEQIKSNGGRTPDDFD